jgi:hypothetical protein
VYDIHFVGLRTLRELAKVYHRNTIFFFDEQQEFNELGSSMSIAAFLFTDADRWGLDLNVSSLVRNLEVHISDGDIMLDRDSIHSQLDVLLKIQRETKIKICMHRLWSQDSDVMRRMARSVTV